MSTAAVADLRENWKTSGFIFVEQFGDDSLWGALTAESEEEFKRAERIEHDKFASRRDGSFTSPQRFFSGKPGPAVTGLLRSKELIELAREATGLGRLIPARCGYNYYSTGDYLGFHRDAVRCTVTFTFALTDNVPPMDYDASLWHASNEELAEVVRERGFFPTGPNQVETPYRGLLGFDGYNIPHWRSPFPGELGTVGTLCFFEL